VNAPKTPARPPEEDSWATDARTLIAEFGDAWAIVRSSDNPLILVCTLESGTTSHVIAGRPGSCLDRIRALPKVTPDEPTIIRADSGAWISGPGN
jgi:hypothetical protein